MVLDVLLSNRARKAEQWGSLCFDFLIVFVHCGVIRAHTALSSKRSDDAKCINSIFTWAMNIVICMRTQPKRTFSVRRNSKWLAQGMPRLSLALGLAPDGVPHGVLLPNEVGLPRGIKPHGSSLFSLIPGPILSKMSRVVIVASTWGRRDIPGILRTQLARVVDMWHISCGTRR